ncbi:MAG: glycosyltransferase family 39 protein [Chloroflexota bacterium]
MRPQKTHYLLAGVFVLSLFLRLFRIGLDGFGNLYYAATVQSLLTSGHNFFFASFDPAGFVSVDKPPLGFWIQALSVLIFGFHGWALILPQALAGSLSTLVLYKIVQRAFGKRAGGLAALILAVTPISVAVDRNNTPDSLVVFLVLLAGWAALKAAESGRLRWLLASAALVGLGFNVKMLQAYLVVPALFLFLPPPHALFKRLAYLSLAGLVMFSLSFAWPLAVDSIPAGQRPYVGSTATNRVMELVAVHNGARRLGQIVALFGIREKESPSALPPAPAQPLPPPAADSAKPWPDSGWSEIGDPGLLRLFNPQMAGQVSWLLPLSLLALASGMARASWKLPLNRQASFHLFWAGWLIPILLLFSYGGLIHRYYLGMLAPPIAAISAVGLVAWFDDYRAGKRRPLPLAVFLTVAVTVFFLGYYPQAAWLLIPLGLLSLLSLASFLLPLSHPRFPLPARAAVILLALLLVPAYWSLTPGLFGGDVTLPHASPDLAYWGGQRDALDRYESTAVFLQSQRQDEIFLAATENAVIAAPLQLVTGQPVMALGGFTGADPILTLEELARRVADGEARFFLMDTQPLHESQYLTWVRGNCRPVDGFLPPENLTLYDCR